MALQITITSILNSVNFGPQTEKNRIRVSTRKHR